MHIVQIYHSRVPVKLYGGMERVVETLCEGLLEMGHQVSLIAFRGDYEIPGVNFLDLDRFGPNEADRRYVELIPSNADVLHFHIPMKQDELGLPYVMTMHGNLTKDQPRESLPQNSVFISRDHAQRHGREVFVYHGYNPESIPFSTSKLDERQHYAFLGRGSLKRKGLHLAKSLAKKLALPLHIGGKRGLSWGNNRYLGHLDNAQKYQLLGSSRALLFPILWDEPFGLVQIEAMFCGSSVLALKRGSVAEVLGQPGGKELFICRDSFDELLEIPVNWHTSIEPLAIRDYAKKYFSHISMCQQYLDLYRQFN